MPVFEGGWACSQECLEAMVDRAVRREGPNDGAAESWTHRLPLSLVLLEQGSITEVQLREARERLSGGCKDGLLLEEWLLNSGVLTEGALTRAVSAQWNCPVFTLAESLSPAMTSALPAFLAEAMGALPVRVSDQLYLAFSERIDRSLSYAVEHITGLRVSAGIARGAEFRREQARFLSFRSPRTRFLDAESPGALVRGLAAVLEEERPTEARLARVHDLWWLRIWRRERDRSTLPASDAVEDWLATAGGREDMTKLEETAHLPIRKAEGGGASCRE